MVYQVDHWSAQQARWTTHGTVNAFGRSNALDLAKRIVPPGPFRVQPVANAPQANICPLALPYRPSSDPTFARPKGYTRPPSPAARRKQAKPR